jgi:hypothetical protein
MTASRENDSSLHAMQLAWHTRIDASCGEAYIAIGDPGTIE